MEELRHSWGDVFVYDRKDCSGNQKLIETGGIPYTIDERKLCEVLKTQTGAAKKSGQDQEPRSEEVFRQMTLDDLLEGKRKPG